MNTFNWILIRFKAIKRCCEKIETFALPANKAVVQTIDVYDEKVENGLPGKCKTIENTKVWRIQSPRMIMQ